MIFTVVWVSNSKLLFVQKSNLKLLFGLSKWRNILRMTEAMFLIVGEGNYRYGQREL